MGGSKNDEFGCLNCLTHTQIERRERRTIKVGGWGNPALFPAGEAAGSVYVPAASSAYPLRRSKSFAREPNKPCVSALSAKSLMT
jgi:hypothetical protein